MHGCVAGRGGVVGYLGELIKVFDAIKYLGLQISGIKKFVRLQRSWWVGGWELRLLGCGARGRWLGGWGGR